MSAVVEFEQVRVAMEPEGREAEFSFTANAGEWVAFVGPNRSGKSLILKLCAGLVAPEGGTVRLFGRDPTRLAGGDRLAMQRRIGIVLQQPGLLSNMTVFNNMALPLRYHGEQSEREIEQVVLHELEAFGLMAVRDLFPAELNRGEARCVAMARVCAMRCELALFDDPTDGLDVDMIERLGRLFMEYRARTGITMLMTAGAPSTLLNRVDRVGLVRDGRLVAIGRWEELINRQAAGIQSYVGL